MTPYSDPSPVFPGLASQGIPDPAAAAALMSLRDCLCQQVAQTTYGPVCRCYVAWGPALPVQDGCSCACGDSGEHNGDAWVKLDSLEPDLGGTAGNNELVGWCPPGWAATISMGVYRCLPVAEGEDVMPAEQITDISLALLSDMAAVWRVLSCCPAVLGEGVRVIGWTPIDTSGGCGGGSLTIQIPLSGMNACAS